MDGNAVLPISHIRTKLSKCIANGKDNVTVPVGSLLTFNQKLHMC